MVPGMTSGGAWLGVSVPQLPCELPPPMRPLVEHGDFAAGRLRVVCAGEADDAARAPAHRNHASSSPDCIPLPAPTGRFALIRPAPAPHESIAWRFTTCRMRGAAACNRACACAPAMHRRDRMAPTCTRLRPRHHAACDVIGGARCPLRAGDGRHVRHRERPPPFRQRRRRGGRRTRQCVSGSDQSDCWLTGCVPRILRRKPATMRPAILRRSGWHEHSLHVRHPPATRPDDERADQRTPACLRAPTSGWLAAVICALDEALLDHDFSRAPRPAARLLDSGEVPAAVSAAAQDRLQRFEEAVQTLHEAWSVRRNRCRCRRNASTPDPLCLIPLARRRDGVCGAALRLTPADRSRTVRG